MKKRTKLQKKSKQNIEVQEVLHKSLSIQFSLGGFSFCITNFNTKEILLFATYSFSVATPEILLDKIKAIFNSDKSLQQDFEEINVIHQNNLSTVVPNAFFNEKELKLYLQYTIKTLANDYITFDELAILQAKNVYIPFVNINNFLFQNFGEFEFKHHSTILIEKLLQHSKGKQQQFYVNVQEKDIDIVATQNDKLLLYNSFSYQTKEDFIYYILFVAEQLGLNYKEFPLTFLGNITKEAETYQIACKYINHIHFINTEANFFTSEDDFEPHSNYILIS